MPRSIAVYLSSHGLGHAVRVAAVLEELRQRLPLALTVVAGCDRRIWPESLAGITTSWIDSPVDAGVVQSDDVTVDRGATAVRLDLWLANLPALVEREAMRLRDGFDLVLGDVPPPAFTAAKITQIQSVAIANFSWDWIYSELGFSEAASVAAAAYAQADLLLEASPAAPMTAFRRREQVGLIHRRPGGSRDASRRALGLSEGETAVLVAFQPAFASRVEIPPPKVGRRILLPTGWAHHRAGSDVLELPAGSRFEDALMAADVVIGKPGYGLIGDVEAARAKFLYVPRPGFPENTVLEAYLARREGTRPLSQASFLSGGWTEALEQMDAGATPSAVPSDGASRAADAIARLLTN